MKKIIFSLKREREREKRILKNRRKMSKKCKKWWGDLLNITVGISVANKICHSMWEIHQSATSLFDPSQNHRSSYTQLTALLSPPCDFTINTSTPPSFFFSLLRWNTLTTSFHRSRGLQWAAVLLAGGRVLV